MKHRKSYAPDVPLNLYQGKFPHQNRYQHILIIGNSANTGAISEGRLFLADELPMTFRTGRLFTFATDFQNQPFIYLLAIAKMDIKSKRCGIWAVKPRLLEGVDEPWLNVLSRTRHGFIQISMRTMQILFGGIVVLWWRCLFTPVESGHFRIFNKIFS